MSSTCSVPGTPCGCTVFGSAGRGADIARDLDVGVLVEPGAEFDVVGVITDLVELTGTDAVDVAHLNRGGPVIRERALVGSVGLYESSPGALADAQAAASPSGSRPTRCGG